MSRDGLRYILTLLVHVGSLPEVGSVAELTVRVCTPAPCLAGLGLQAAGVGLPGSERAKPDGCADVCIGGCDSEQRDGSRSEYGLKECPHADRLPAVILGGKRRVGRTVLNM